MDALPLPLDSANEPIVTDFPFPTLAVTVPEPVTLRVSVPAKLLIVFKSVPLRVVVPSYTLEPLAVTDRVITSIVAVPDKS